MNIYEPGGRAGQSDICKNYLSANDVRNIDNQIDKIIEEVSSHILQEQDAADRALDYVDSLDDMTDASLQSFIREVYAQLDAYCTASKSVKILKILNGYAKMDADFFNNLEIRYGKTSQRVEKFRRFVLQSPPKADQDIWMLKKSSLDAFIEILKLASEEHRELIPRPCNAHMALLRFHVVSLLEKLEKCEEENMPEPAVVGYVAYFVGVMLTRMDIDRQMTVPNSVDRIVKIGSRMIQHNLNVEKYRAVREAAKGAWDNGCELLHTQMLFLLEAKTGLLDNLEKVEVKNKLKGWAPSNLVFGAGAKKIINTCPCDKRKKCPLISQYGITKRISLPTSKRPKRSSS